MKTMKTMEWSPPTPTTPPPPTARTTTCVAFAAALLSGVTPLSAQGHPTVAAPVEIPLTLRGGRMVVPVRATDGAELSFIVGTGAAVTVLSESTAARVGQGELTLGGVALNLQDRQTLPDDRLTFDGFTADGMVGNSTLNRYDELFDVPGGRLVLKPFGRSVEWPGMTLSDPIRLRVLHGVVPTLDVEVNGTAFPALLELSAQSLLVNQAVLDEGGVTGGKATTLTLGPSTFRDVPIRLSDSPIIARFTSGSGFVIVGAPLVWDCAVSLSWVHQELRTCVP